MEPASFSTDFGSSQLCANCSSLQLSNEWIDIVKDDNLESMRPDFELRHSFPGLPGLKTSSEGGCGFCRLLRQVLTSEDCLHDLRYLGVPVDIGDSGIYVSACYRVLRGWPGGHVALDCLEM